MKNALPLPSIEFLNQCFYVSDDGLITWKERPAHHFKSIGACTTWNKRFKGKSAESTITIDGEKVRRVCISDIRYYSHRIIYHMINGEVTPDHEVDHEDLDRLNNKPKNLRLCFSSQNCQNKSLYKNNQSGFKGVSWHKISKKWAGRISCNKENFFKTFNDIEDAKKWVSEMRKKLHKEFGRKN